MNVGHAISNFPCDILVIFKNGLNQFKHNFIQILKGKHEYSLKKKTQKNNIKRAWQLNIYTVQYLEEGIKNIQYVFRGI